MSANESRPKAAPEAVVATATSVDRAADIARMARRHEYAVRVVFERADHVFCSQVMTNLYAAERKVRRCHERGLSASMSLVRIVPVPMVTSDDLALVAGGEQW